MKKGFLKKTLSYALTAALALGGLVGLGGTAKAEGERVVTFYYNSDSTNLNVCIWDGSSVALTDNDTASEFVSWGSPAKMNAVEDQDGWFSIELEVTSSAVAGGFGIYGDTDSDVKDKFSEWDNTSIYTDIITGTDTEIAVQWVEGENQEWHLQKVDVPGSVNNNNQNGEGNGEGGGNGESGNGEGGNGEGSGNGEGNGNESGNSEGNGNESGNSEGNGNESGNTGDNKEDGKFTLYVYNEKGGKMYLNIWNWKGLKVADGAAYSDPFNWGKDIAEVPATDKAGWYAIDLIVLDPNAEDGFDVYVDTEANNIIKSDNKWGNSPEIYKELVSGSKKAYAISGGKVVDATATESNATGSNSTDKNVKTGDESHVALMAIIMLASAGACFVAFKKRKEA